MVQTQAEPKRSDGSAVGASRRALGYLAGVSALVLLVDILSKQLATSLLDPDHPVRLLGGALYLSLTRNPGAAFSLFRDFTAIFPLIALGVAVWIGFMARNLRSTPWAVALGLVLGGAVGNVIDRIFRAPAFLSGHVVDFFSLFDPHGRAFAIFNVADMALTFGVILAVLLELLGRQRDGSRTPRRGTTDGAA
jgi:signal peptidase II